MDVSELYVRQTWMLYGQLKLMTESETDISAIHIYVCPEQPSLDLVALTMTDGTYRFVRDGVVDDAAPF